MRLAGRTAAPLRALHAALLLCALFGTGAAAQAPTRWDPDARVVVGLSAVILAVTSDAWTVHAATPAALISYDPVARRWELPLTFEDGYPVREGPSALVALRGEQTLVLGTQLGTLWRVDPVGRTLERVATVPGAVQRIVAGEFGAVHVRSSRGWFRLEAGSFFPEPLAAEPAGARETAEPRLQALAGRIALDARGRRWPITGWTRGRRPEEYFVGTAGGGLVRVDVATHEVERLPYGLGSQGVGALAEIGGRTWFGGEGTADGSANVAWADSALARWAWPGRPGDELPRGFVAAAAGHEGHVWLGARDGLFRGDSAGASWTRLRGLPSERVTALLAHERTLWVGTDRGACAWQTEDCSATVLPGARITALASCHGALWLGTETGLYRAGPGEAPERTARPGLQAARVQALACMADSLFVATPQSLYVNRAGTWHGPLQLGARGTLRALAVRGQSLWVAGDGGVAHWDAGGGDWTYYTAPRDVPLTPIWALLPTERYLWLATAGGAMRIDLRPR